MACSGLKMGSFHLFRHPKWSRIIFGKNPFLNHFLTHFLSQTSPFSRHKHLFWHSMWPRIIFDKSLFFAPGGPC